MPIELDLDPGIRRGLQPGGEEFLQGVAEALEEDYVRSVMLFGSVVSGEATPLSDVDLIVVFADDTPDSYVTSSRRRLVELAQTHLDAGADSRFERFVDRHTGMFRSGFVTTVSTVEKAEFHDVFETSRLAYVLAPWRTVMASVFVSAVAIYGRPVRPDWDHVDQPTQRSGRELLRSWLTATLLAVAQLPYAVVSRRAMQYAMEAHKWSLYNCAYHVVGAPVSLAEAAALVPDTADSLGGLIERRADPSFAWTYVVMVPVIVTVLHCRALWTSLRGRADVQSADP